MLFLILDAGDDHSMGYIQFQSFVTSMFLKYEDSEFPNRFIFRKKHDLEDVVFDFESPDSNIPHEELLFKAKSYDKLDAVFFYGEDNQQGSNPWDADYFHVQLLMKMCIQTRKPLFAAGFCGVLFCYMLSSQSTFVYTLNHAGGSHETQRLASLPHYYEGNKGVWIHKDSGDVYGFDHIAQSWYAIGNLGISQASAAARLEQESFLTKPTGPASVEPEPIICRVSSENPALLKRIPKEFDVSETSRWQLASPGPLDSLGFCVLVEQVTPPSPRVLYKDLCLLIPSSFEDTDRQIPLPFQRLLHNYIRLLSETLLSHDKLRSSLADMLFGSIIFHSDLTSKTPLLLPPTSTASIPTLLTPDGPSRIPVETSSASINKLLKTKLIKDSQKFPAIRTEVNPKKPRIASSQYRFLEPKMSRAKRLKIFLADKDYSVPPVDVSVDDTSMQISFSHDISSSRLYSAYGESDYRRSHAGSIGGHHSPSGSRAGDREPHEQDEDSISEEETAFRTNRPVSLLSKTSKGLLQNKRRPVSASILQAKLPLHFPTSDVTHEATVVLSAHGTRPYSSYSKYQNMPKVMPEPPPPAVKPPPKSPEGPPFYRHFGKMNDPIARSPGAHWGPNTKIPPDQAIHGDCQRLFLKGPWK